MSKISRTIHMSDTVDHFNRRIHVNVRNGSPTMVYRWKDRKSAKLHTQRMTLTDSQAARLLVLLANQVDKALQGDKSRLETFKKTFAKELDLVALA